MSSKQMKFSTAAHAELKRGVDQIAKAVAVTMGPAGRNVIVQNLSAVHLSPKTASASPRK